MAKDKGSGKSDKGKDKDKEKVPEVPPGSPLQSLPDPIERTINITIDSLQNVSGKEGVKVTLLVQHNDITIGESEPIKVDLDCGDPPATEINYSIPFTMIINHRNSIDAVVSKPILITVMQTGGNGGTDASTIDAESKGKTSATPKSKTAKTPTAVSYKVMGLCNLDVMPLLLGEQSVTEKLLLEAPGLRTGGAIVSWPNLPFLIVTMSTDDVEMFPPDMQVNFLSITVESLYNPLTTFTDTMNYRAATVAYIDSETPDDVIFDDGKWTNVRNVEGTKRWQTLNHVESRAKLSKYKINCDNEATKNELKKEVDLEKKLLEDAPRIEWNSMCRYMMLHLGSQMMNDNINRYKCWPFQFVVGAKVSDAGRAKSKDPSVPQLFQCYVNVTELVYPGKSSTRVVAQLYTYSASAMAEKTGLEKGIFEKEMTKEPKEKEKKGKPATRGGSAPAPIIAQVETEVVQSLPVTSDNGEPMFVIIEFELLLPLQKARDLIDLSDCIDQMITKLIVPPYAYTGDLAEDLYYNCIRKLVDTIREEYQDFMEINASEASVKGESETKTDPNLCSKSTQPNAEHECTYAYIPDELSCFIQYLHSSGAYLAIRTALKNKITLLLDQKFKVEFHTLDHKKWQNFVATTYIFFVEKMHRALNKGVEGQLAKGHAEPSTTDRFSFYAEEAYELGFLEDARNYYLTMIAAEVKNPDKWLEYAIFLMKIGDLDRCTECCREAVALDKQHKIALLLYGLILVYKEEYRDAEIFLEGVTHLYPRFAEGWTILHLFYLRTEYFSGVDITIQVAQKCLKDKDPDVIASQFLNRDPLAWTTFNCPKDRIYIITAVLLIKMGCLDFAGVALAQELSVMGRSTPLLYHMAVHHYMEHRYSDALSHLEEAVCQHGMDYSLGSLMGHCHREEGNFDDAVYCYEFANSTFDSPEDLHLVQLRLGYHYIDTEQYDKAKMILLITCKNSPTCRTWLGVGIAFYHLNQMKEAEAVLSEANKLDAHNPEVWGYLCLLNMSLMRYDEFVQCYRQVVKNNLKNVNLWLMITELMEVLDYPIPVLSMASQEDAVKESVEEKGEERCDCEAEECGEEGETLENLPPQTETTNKKDKQPT